jgi:hypothetical protein
LKRGFRLQRYLVGLSSALVAGCTFLIDFEAVPTGPGADDAHASADRTEAPDASVFDASRARDAAVEADAQTAVKPCTNAPDGTYCGGNRTAWPNGLKDDRVTCRKGEEPLVVTCATGQGCVAMPDGYPDECDACEGKTDGTYCGRDFSSWSTKNAHQRIRCQGGRIVGSLLCTACKSSGANSTCQ